MKERGGEGRICITGVRWEESNARRKRRPFEIVTPRKEDRKLFNDNAEERRMFENCMQKGKRVVNPIIDWTEEDVWEYLNSRGIEHCELYDKGKTRIGCIGCPISKNRMREFEDYPKFKDNYIRAIERFLSRYLERCKKRNAKPFRETAEEWFNWWIEQETVSEVDYTESFLDDEMEGAE